MEEKRGPSASGTLHRLTGLQTAEGDAVTIFIVLGVLIVASIILNTFGTVAAIRLQNRKRASQGTKTGGIVLNLLGWFFFPLFSIGPIVMDHEAGKQASPARRLRDQE